MNLFSMHNNLSSFLSGDMKAETEKMLDALGYVPKDQAGAGQSKPEDIEKMKETAKAEAMAAGKEEGRKEGVEAAAQRAVKIVEMCETAGLPESKAVELIKSEKSDEELHQAVTDAKAAANDQHIQSTVSATGIGETNPVLEDAQKRAEAAKARMNG